MGHSTYSFKDLTVTLTHKSLGQLTLQGEGIGSIAFSLANDVSVQDLAADGSVMTSKIKADNGIVTITLQQTSEANKWLTKAFNYVNSAPAREWAGFSLMATSVDMQVTHEGSGMAFQKRADKNYQQQGEQITWTFLASNLQER